MTIVYLWLSSFLTKLQFLAQFLISFYDSNTFYIVYAEPQ